jgi:hypothetical protein
MSDEPSVHPCIFESKELADSYIPMFMHRCRCHEDKWSIRRQYDDDHRCPVTGQVEQEPEQ